jgi:nitrous oxide reductase accessory protein NosL
MTGRTVTNRIMIDYVTVRSNTASAMARVNAFLIDTRQRKGALGADDAFRFAERRRAAIARQARAGGVALRRDLTLTIRTAR